MKKVLSIILITILGFIAWTYISDEMQRRREEDANRQVDMENEKIEIGIAKTKTETDIVKGVSSAEDNFQFDSLVKDFKNKYGYDYFEKQKK